MNPYTPSEIVVWELAKTLKEDKEKLETDIVGFQTLLKNQGEILKQSATQVEALQKEVEKTKKDKQRYEALANEKYCEFMKEKEEDVATIKRLKELVEKTSR